jgi:hypothetical protein
MKRTTATSKKRKADEAAKGGEESVENVSNVGDEVVEKEE